MIFFLFLFSFFFSANLNQEIEERYFYDSLVSFSTPQGVLSFPWSGTTQNPIATTTTTTASKLKERVAGACRLTWPPPVVFATPTGAEVFFFSILFVCFFLSYSTTQYQLICPRLSFRQCRFTQSVCCLFLFVFFPIWFGKIQRWFFFFFFGRLIILANVRR